MLSPSDAITIHFLIDTAKNSFPSLTVLKRNKYANAAQNEIICEITVASAAPPTPISKAKIKVADQIYTGEALEPAGEAVVVTVKINKVTVTLEEGVDYEIVEDGYSKNINKGKAKLTIRGIGEYGGMKTGTFKITAQTMSWADWYTKVTNWLKGIM